jgi:pilus assembly protein CpaE
VAVLQGLAGVAVLAYPPETLESVAIEAAPMRQMLHLLRSQCECTVLDLGHRLGTAAQEALKVADAVVLVIRLDVPALRLARRLLRSLLEQDVPQEKVRVVANRYGQSRQVGWKQAEEALGSKVHVWVPEDSGALNKALNQGQPLLSSAPRAKITRRLGELAALLTP